MHEVGSGDCPALGDLGEWYGALCWEVEVVGSAQGKVCEEFEVAHTVGAELEVGSGNTVYGCALEGLEVVEMDGARETETFEFTLDLGREEGFACWECDAAGSGGNGVLVYHGRVVLDPKVYSLLLCGFSHKVVKVDRLITLVLERNRLIAMPRLARLVYCAGLNGFRRRNLFVAVSRQSRLLK